MKKYVYKIGDMIRICCPEIVVRVGYPKSIFDKDIEEKVDNYSLKINAFVVDAGMPWQDNGAINVIERHIKMGLAYGFLYNKGFGGNQRSIHASNYKEYAGLIGKILKIKTVKTGLRTPVPRSFGFERPFYLKNIKTHKLLLISFPRGKGYRRAWIEEKNVELFKEN